LSDFIIEGIFIKECNHRFKCIVKINGAEELCYVPSSSRLSPLINLENKKVLVKKNSKTSSNLNYKLFAVENRNSFILLDLLYINKLVYSYIYNSKKFAFAEIIPEYKFSNGYKSDFLLRTGEQRIVIEAKSVLTINSIAKYPSFELKRAIKQLKAIKELLLQINLKVLYWFIFLNPDTDSLELKDDKSEYYLLFKECLGLGMEVYISKIDCDFNKNFSIKDPFKLQ
jgi:DNA-binding sugar fermentation-stimulating protein